jgi:hypothetical protein
MLSISCNITLYIFGLRLRIIGKVSYLHIKANFHVYSFYIGSSLI